MRTFNATTANNLVSNLQGLVGDLYCRWLDEYKYEDIDDYAAPIERVVGDKVKMTKRPFGFKLVCEYTYKDGTTLESELKVECKARTYGWTVKPVKGAKPAEKRITLYSNDEGGGVRTGQVYAHGLLEDDMQHDYITASEALVDGAKCEWHGKPCICFMWQKSGMTRGLVCYESDLEAIGYCKAMKAMCA